MKKQFFLAFLMLSISYNIFSQSSGTINEDEKTRIKLAVHLITYDTIGGFDNAAGDAYYSLVLSSFRENLYIPQLSSSVISFNDKTKIEKIIQLLSLMKQNPPSWDDLFLKQTQYLIWLDKATHKKSIYKEK